jgi:molecular chaperone GrpE
MSSSTAGGDDELRSEASAGPDEGPVEPADETVADGVKDPTDAKSQSGSGEVDDLDARLEEIFVAEADPLSDALRERDEYLDDLRRLQAEFENYRKRMARQGEELTERAAAAVLERMLPVLDALDLARSHAGEPSDAVAAQLAEALGQISSLARDALAREGLERIDDVGVAFDPSIHDAVAHDPGDDGEQVGVVVAEVLRPGYRLKGRVVRPAMVRVRG